MDPSQNKDSSNNNSPETSFASNPFPPTVILPSTADSVPETLQPASTPTTTSAPVITQTPQDTLNATPETPVPDANASVPPANPFVAAASPESVNAQSSSSQPIPQVTTAQPAVPEVFARDDVSFSPIVPPHKKSNKKLFIIGGSVAAMLLLIAAGVFGFYLPNRPAAVWNTGLNRTGDALSTVVASATEKKTLETLSTSKIDGTVDANFQETTYKGTITSKFKDNDSQSGVTLTMKSADTDMDIDIQALTELVKDKKYPNGYVKFTGLKELGVLDMFAPGLNAYDGKWISIPSETYQKIMNQASEEKAKESAVTSADVAEIARVSIGVTNDYVFSTDPAKAILQQKTFVGKETVDGIQAYHYKISLNKQHITDYCVELVNEITKTAAFKNITGYEDKEIKSSREDGVKGCKEDRSSGNDSEGPNEYDLWIDAKYKLIYKVRDADEKNKGSYQEFGQRYKGGDELTFFYNNHNDKEKQDFKVVSTYNSKTFVTALNVDGESKDKDFPYTFAAKITFEPSKDEVKITAPKDAVPIETILQQLGVPLSEFSGGSGGNIQQRAEDSERQTDINALTGQTEAYYALNGSYPTLAQLNNANWRQKNMYGLDQDALKDPAGNSAVLFAVKTANNYAYLGNNCTTTGCEAYKFVAVLSDGTVYEKNSF